MGIQYTSSIASIEPLHICILGGFSRLDVQELDSMHQAPVGGELGVGETTEQNGQNRKFKVPSLRNAALRAPYMHDGRFADLGEVIDHYSTGIQNHPTLQPFLQDQNGNPIQYNFTTAEKNALIAFLNTLTDEDLITDEKLRDPFL